MSSTLETTQNPAVTAARRRKKSRGTAGLRLGFGILGILIVLIPWEILSRTGAINEVLLSSPTQVWDNLVKQVTGDVIWGYVWATFKEWALGFSAAVVVGIFIGLMAGWFRRVYQVANPWLNVLYATPHLALVPIFILWFGLGIGFKVWLGFLVAVFVIAVNTIAGVRATDPCYITVANTYGASKIKLFATVVLPATTPYIMTGMRQAAGRALVGVIAAEFLSSNDGLGYFILLSGQTLNTPSVMSGLIFLAVFGIVTGEIFRWFEGRFESWRRPASG